MFTESSLYNIQSIMKNLKNLNGDSLSNAGVNLREDYRPLMTPMEFLTESQPIGEGESVTIASEYAPCLRADDIDDEKLNKALLYHLGPLLKPDMSNIESLFPNLFEEVAKAVSPNEDWMREAVSRVMNCSDMLDTGDSWGFGEMGINTFHLATSLDNIIKGRGWDRNNMRDFEKASLLDAAMSSEAIAHLAHRASMEILMQKHAHVHTAFLAVFRLKDSPESHMSIMQAVRRYRESCAPLYASLLSIGRKFCCVEAVAVKDLYAMEIAAGRPIASPSLYHLKRYFDFGLADKSRS